MLYGVRIGSNVVCCTRYLTLGLRKDHQSRRELPDTQTPHEHSFRNGEQETLQKAHSVSFWNVTLELN